VYIYYHPALGKNTLQSFSIFQLTYMRRYNLPITLGRNWPTPSQWLL